MVRKEEGGIAVSVSPAGNQGTHLVRILGEKQSKCLSMGYDETTRQNIVENIVTQKLFTCSPKPNRFQNIEEKKKATNPY